MTGVLVIVVAFAAVVAVGYFYSRQLNARSAELHDRALRELRRVIDEVRLEDESPPSARRSLAITKAAWD